MTTGRRVVDRIDTLADWPATPDARYLLASGATTGATSQAQTFTNGVITGKIYPPSNSANAVGLYRANGTTQDFYYDSTNGRFGIGVTPSPSIQLSVLSPSDGTTQASFKAFSASQFANFLEFRDYDGTLLSAVNRQGWGVGIAGTPSYKIDAIENTNVQIARFKQLNTSYPAIIQLDRPNVFRGAAFVITTGGSTYNWYMGAAYRLGGTSNNFYIGQASNFSPDSTTSVLTLSTAGYVGVSLGTTNPTAYMDLSAPTASAANLRLRDGTLPTTPNDGDIAKATGFYHFTVDAGTNAVVNQIIGDRASSGTPAAGFGLGFTARLHSSTTKSQDAGRLTWEWDVATHASRASRGKLSAYYTTTERVCIDWKADSSGPLIGFLGATPVAKPAAYTQTYATAARTIAAYTTDAENVAYTGIDNLQVGSVYAQLTDLNALRTAYENLRASYDGLIQVVNSIIDDNQAYGLFA